MCGIAGGCGIPPERTAEAINLIRHRGPDDTGSAEIAFGDLSISLGHARLAILDLTQAGHQPMESRDERWTVTYNGEIYNHLELRSQIGGQFRGHSDTETLVEALALWGIRDTLRRLNGMFAFAAVDKEEGYLHLARDPFGIKPLYVYSDNAGRFAFASEIRALKALIRFETGINSDALQTFLTLRYIPSPRTLWNGVRRVPPGHFISRRIGERTEQIERYIEPTRDRFQGSLSNAVDTYHSVLDETIRRQLMADVPVGILLSGGVDSALLASMARRHSPDLTAFTVGFGEKHQECEIDAASETAETLGIQQVAVKVTAQDCWDVIEDVASSVEEPLGTVSVLPMFHLVRTASQHVTVVLTGQGSDEPWGGYRRYQMELVRPWVPFPHLGVGLTSALRQWVAIPEMLERGLRAMAERDEGRRFEEAYALFNGAEREQLTGDFTDGGVIRDIEYWRQWINGAAAYPVERMMRIDCRMNLADDLLLYGDKISMAVSLEARVPMLDIDVVRFVESLPLKYRVRLGRTKVVHKLLAERCLPKEIVSRPKRGFEVPFGFYSRGSWRPWIEELLLDPGAPHWDGLEKNTVERWWREHLARRPDRSRQIFALLMLALWWRSQSIGGKAIGHGRMVAGTVP